MRFGSIIVGVALAQRRTRRNRNRPDDPETITNDELPIPTTVSPTLTNTTTTTITDIDSKRSSRTTTSNLPDFIPPTRVPNSTQQDSTGTSPFVWIVLVSCLALIFIVAGGLLMYQRKRIVEREFKTVVVQ